MKKKKWEKRGDYYYFVEAVEGFSVIVKPYHGRWFYEVHTPNGNVYRPIYKTRKNSAGEQLIKMRSLESAKNGALVSYYRHGG